MPTVVRAVSATSSSSIDRSPLKQQEAESDVMYERFCQWLDNPTQTFEELAQQCGIRADSLGRHSRNYLWKERLALSGKLKNSKGKRLAEAKLPAPPEPIERGLIQFALEYLPAIAPDFQLDSLMEMFLIELEKWVEGEHNFLQISPHPRSGKSLAACAAMAYSYLRYPTRHQILISASGRLSAIANQRLRTLIEIALPEGFELAKDSRSKLAFSGNWLGAGLQYAASRGGQLMGLTGNRILCDDLVSSTQEVESPEVMAQAMRTMTTDLFTRLTNDSYGKGSGLCFIAQRISNTDLVAEMIARERKNEELGLKTTPWRCLVSPFLNPTLEEKVRILESYPDAWTVVWPRFGDVGQPVCNRFTVEFGETLRANMSERDWTSMYELRTDVEDYCPWRRTYLQELEEEDIRISQTFIAVDLNMAGGDRKSDKSALAVGGIQDGNVVILGLHYLQGGLEEQMDQIDTYANSYNAMVVYVEKAAAGHAVLNSMGNFIGDRAYNVRPISHKGKNKGQRLNDVLGPASSGKFFIRKGLELTPVLHEQLKLIAITKGKTKRNDDVGDVVVHLLTAGWYQHVKSGYGQGAVTWGQGIGSGMTECSWGYGRPVPRIGIDGVERYSIPGFA